MKDFYKYRQEFTWSCQRALNSGHLTLRHCGCSVLHTARRKSRLNGYWLYILKRRIGSFTFWWINRRDRRETHRQNGCDGNSCIHENWKQERNRQEDVRVTLRTSTSENKHCKEEMIVFFDCYKIHSRSSTSTHRYDASCSRFILNTSVSETATWIKTVQEETMLARSPYIYWFQIGPSL